MSRGTMSWSFCVIRGGGWYSTRRFARAADRNTRDPSNRLATLGFRLMRRMP